MPFAMKPDHPPRWKLRGPVFRYIFRNERLALKKEAVPTRHAVRWNRPSSAVEPWNRFRYV